MIDATTFPDAEAEVISAIKAIKTSLFVSNATPSPIPGEAVTVGFSGGGSRDWGEASTNLGINVFAPSDDECAALVRELQDILAATSNGMIQSVSVPAGGGTSIPSQSPPFQRYFAATVYLRGQSLIEVFDPS